MANAFFTSYSLFSFLFLSFYFVFLHPGVNTNTQEPCSIVFCFFSHWEKLILCPIRFLQTRTVKTTETKTKKFFVGFFFFPNSIINLSPFQQQRVIHESRINFTLLKAIYGISYTRKMLNISESSAEERRPFQRSLYLLMYQTRKKV